LKKLRVGSFAGIGMLQPGLAGGCSEGKAGTVTAATPAAQGLFDERGRPEAGGPLTNTSAVAATNGPPLEAAARGGTFRRSLPDTAPAAAAGTQLPAAAAPIDAASLSRSSSHCLGLADAGTEVLVTCDGRDQMRPWHHEGQGLCWATQAGQQATPARSCCTFAGRLCH
jgi:hypothetical protein